MECRQILIQSILYMDFSLSVKFRMVIPKEPQALLQVLLWRQRMKLPSPERQWQVLLVDPCMIVQVHTGGQRAKHNIMYVTLQAHG